MKPREYAAVVRLANAYEVENWSPPAHGEGPNKLNAVAVPELLPAAWIDEHVECWDPKKMSPRIDVPHDPHSRRHLAIRAQLGIV